MQHNTKTTIYCTQHINNNTTRLKTVLQPQKGAWERLKSWLRLAGRSMSGGSSVSSPSVVTAARACLSMMVWTSSGSLSASGLPSAQTALTRIYHEEEVHQLIQANQRKLPLLMLAPGSLAVVEAS